MAVKLSIEITSPLEPEDRDMLSGVAIMTLAIANHEMAKHRFPEMFTDEDEDEDGEDDHGDEGGGTTLVDARKPR
jgi:hypothetical protein